jgi:iron complex transport system substrate-binding protein
MEPLRKNDRSKSDAEGVASIIVDCAYRLHVEAGPGLFESVYEPVLTQLLRDAGLKVQCQVVVPVEILGYRFERGFRADLIVEDLVLVELKSVEMLSRAHAKQVITYLRLLGLPLGLLLNFGAPTFKEGARRFVNRHLEVTNPGYPLPGGKQDGGLPG